MCLIIYWVLTLFWSLYSEARYTISGNSKQTVNNIKQTINSHISTNLTIIWPITRGHKLWSLVNPLKYKCFRIYNKHICSHIFRDVCENARPSSHEITDIRDALQGMSWSQEVRLERQLFPSYFLDYLEFQWHSQINKVCNHHSKVYWFLS